MKKLAAVTIAGVATLAAAHLARILRHAPGSVMPRPRTGGEAPGERPEGAPAPPQGEPEPDRGDDLASASKEQLYEQAQKLEIKGRSKMSKAQLIEAIERARG